MKPILISIILATFLAIVGFNTSIAQTPEQLYQKGLTKEEGEGALQDAINLYNQVADNSNASISLRAKALLHIGMCFEKLGTNEAVKAYQRLVSNFPTQKNEVAIARERLSRLIQIAEKISEAPLIPKFTKIDIPTKPGNGVLSPDGKKLAFISEDAVWIIPLHGKINSDIAGEPVRLARIPGLWDGGSLTAWSADGKWIAVNGGVDGNDAYVIPVGGGQSLVVPIPKRVGQGFDYRLSLSPDGQTLAFSAVDPDMPPETPYNMNKSIYTIPIAGGKSKRVSSRSARLPSFSSDGKFISYVGYTERDALPENTKRSTPNGDLWVVPVAGGTPLKLTAVDGRLRGPLWSPDGKYIAAHYEPGGNNDSKEIWVYPLSSDASGVGEPGKIALPRSSWNILAGWTPNDELGVFIQSEEHAAIYTVPALGGMAVQITPEILYPLYPRWSKNGDRIYFRGFKEDVKVSIVYVPDAGGDPVEIPVQSDRKLVSIVPGGGFNVSPDGKRIVISAYQQPSKPEEGVDLWTIPLGGRPAIRLTNDKSAEYYPCWSPDGRYIAFTSWKEKSKVEGFNAVYVIPAEGGEIRQISSETDSVGDGAITYSPDGLQITFFSGGAIKTISVKGGQTEVLVADIKYDSDSELAYSPDGSKIAHNAENKIWITSLDGGKPQELQTGLPKDTRHSGFSWSPDGKKIVFSSSIGGEAEFWMISNFLPLGKLLKKNDTVKLE
jgi:Tol biopolymer transport system component